jgi:release factor glutamine methyltransferase
MSVVEFAGLELATRPGIVMTPRATSIALIDLAVAHIGNRPCRVVDVGTGSGAIAITIATRSPAAIVWATDRSREAVELAERNIASAGLTDRIFVREGDLLEPVPGPVDVIVANLPYLPAHERSLHPDLASEPAAALFAPGDGQGSYRRLLAAAASRLDEQGLVALQLRGEVISAFASQLAELKILFRAAAA